MINTQLLKAKMILNSDDASDVSQAMKISTATFSAKLNNKKEFKAEEIYVLINRYDLTPQEVMDIFFKKEVTY